mmetsp:Transcript_35452/g.101926  ORF Transcript_35452/g.101926 Transcript_35452/m.101926 type:complete len:378 (-) Transcript_35452:230-1363(-)
MGANCSGCTSEDVGNCTVQPIASCACAFEGPALVKTRLRVGFCSGLYDAPIQLALSRGSYQALSINLQSVQCPPDAGAVMSMLSAGLVDMAVMRTEEAVAFVAEGNALKLCGTYVSAPRTWGVYAGCCSVQTGADLQGGIIGMPEERCASLTISVLGDQPGWVPAMYCPRRPFGSIHRAADAMSKGIIRATVWERRAARHLVASGQWDLVGQVTTPWPALVMVASKEALYSKAGAIKHFIDFSHMACEDFKIDSKSESSNFVSGRYGLGTEDSCDFVAETSWVCQCEVELETILKPLEHLKRAGLVDGSRAYDPAKFLAREFSLVSQIGALSPALIKQTEQRGEEEDFGGLLDPAAARSLEEVKSTLCQDTPPVPAG